MDSFANSPLSVCVAEWLPLLAVFEPAACCSPLGSSFQTKQVHYGLLACGWGLGEVALLELSWERAVMAGAKRSCDQWEGAVIDFNVSPVVVFKYSSSA